MEEQFNQLMDLYESIKRKVREKNPNLYERWKAGGFIVDNNIVSMYPSLSEVMYAILDEDEEDEVDDEA